MRRLFAATFALTVACSDDGATTSSETTTTGAGGSPPTSAAGGAGGAGAGPSAGGAGGAAQGGAGTGGGAEVNGFPAAWPNGTDCNAEEPIFVWAYADDTYILRQSLCTSFEGPFLYLFFGDDKVLLEDTGDGGIPVRDTVQSVIDEWLVAHGKASIELVVMHSHSHGDHTGGDSQFAGQPNTTLVGTSLSNVTSFFGIADWPSQAVTFDLGNRVLDVIPIPGHQQTHVALYDRRRDLLLTGDTLYPGRLYVSDFNAYKASTARLTAFTAQNPVAWVLGTHIEMTTAPMQDFAFQAETHPNEHALQLELADLQELDSAVQAMSGPEYEEHDDFIIYPL
jgi:glyoxylase-like metal-dependent hydrolase (beta-lactamase superfamily II)